MWSLQGVVQGGVSVEFEGRFKGSEFGGQRVVQGGARQLAGQDAVQVWVGGGLERQKMLEEVEVREVENFRGGID